MKHVLDPIAQKFLDDLAAKGGKPLYEIPLAEARKIFSSLQSGKIDKLPVDIEDKMISISPKGQVSIRIIRPKGSKETLPVIVYYHGAGWVFGDHNTHDKLVRELVVGSHSALVFIEYSHSPEAKCPQALEEAYAVTKWIYEHAKELHIDPARMAAAGDSVGGNMAAAITLLCKERNGPKFCYQVLFYPVTDANFDTESYLEYKEGYFLTREAMKWFWNCYEPDHKAREKHTVSVLRASLDQLRGLPPALIINGECDVLRDEGEAYARKLIQAGVSVTATRYLGMIHDFVMLHALSETNAAKGAILQACEMLKKAFTKSAKKERAAA